MVGQWTWVMNIKTFWRSSPHSLPVIKVGKRTFDNSLRIYHWRRRWAMKLIFAVGTKLEGIHKIRPLTFFVPFYWKFLSKGQRLEPWQNIYVGVILGKKIVAKSRYLFWTKKLHNRCLTGYFINTLLTAMQCTLWCKAPVFIGLKINSL